MHFFCTFVTTYSKTMTEKKHTFPKNERLCGEIRVGELFKNGKAYIAYPYRVVYSAEHRTSSEQPQLQVLVNVPKKRHKRAVKRNRIKRLMRESFRLNKDILISKLIASDMCAKVAFNYISDEVLEFEYMNKRMKLAFYKLMEEIEK